MNSEDELRQKIKVLIAKWKAKAGKKRFSGYGDSYEPIYDQCAADLEKVLNSVNPADPMYRDE